MLKITNIATSHVLDLPEGQTITMEIVSMLLGSNEVLQGSYSYPFKFPLNDNNKKFIQNGHLPEADVPPEIGVMVTEGVFAFKALMQYHTEGRYGDGYLLVDLGEIADIIRNQPIREFIKETFIVSTIEEGLGDGPSMHDLANAEPSVFPIVFAPYLSEQFVDESFSPSPGYQRPTLINPYMPAIPFGNFLSTIDGTEGGVVHVPFVYLMWLLRRISTALGFRPTGPALSDDNLKKLVLFNTQSIPGHTGGNYTVEIDRHLPFETIGNLFSALRDFLGLGIFFNTSDRTVYFACYTHLRRVEKSLDLSASYIPGNDKIQRGEWKGFRINNDMASGDEKLEGMLDFVRSFKIGDRPDADITLSISTLAMERALVDQSLGNTPPPGGWTEDSPRWLLPSTSVAGNLSNTFFQKHELEGYDAAGNYVDYVPSVAPDMQHIAELAEADPVSNRWGLRLLMYFGMQEDSTGRLYPQLSSVSYGSRYQTIGALSLLPGQPDDVFRKYQRYWYECLAYSREVEIPMRLSISEASKVRPEVPIFVKMAHLAANRYLLKRVNYELPGKGGFLRARFEVRQITPIRSFSNWSDPDIYGAKWLELRLENVVPNYEEGFNIGDIVIYVWEDGERTIPFNSLSVTANVGVHRKKLTQIIPSQYSEKKYAAGSFQLLEHRNVVFGQVKFFESRLLTLGGQFWENQVILHDRYYLQYGEGYRIIVS